MFKAQVVDERRERVKRVCLFVYGIHSRFCYFEFIASKAVISGEN